MKAQIIKTTGEVIEIEPKNKTDFSLKEMQDIVGGYIEIVHFGNRNCMVVNEEGVYMNLSWNQKASIICQQGGILGDVLICSSNQIK
jgi:phosphosulfolactate synthase (CoM biosynthesis protein A)